MKKWHKIIISIACAVVVLIGLGVYMVTSFFDDMCGNEVYSQILSPDNKFKAIIFERNCGATTGFSTQVSIIDSSKSLENEHGNIYVADGHPKNSSLKLEWDSPTKLILSNSKYVPTKKETHWRNIKVEYQ